jgi:TolA-binding protein
VSRAHTHYVEPRVTDAHVNRLWGNLSARLAARPGWAPRGFWWSGTAVLVAALGAALVLHAATPRTPPRPRQAWVAAEVQTAGTASSFELAEGSKVSLAERSALLVRENTSNAVSLALSQGEAEFDVTHREGRRFTVTARDVQVRVIGTRFAVKAGTALEPRIEVTVLRGVVEVESKRRPGVVARVTAGQTWVQAPGPAPTTAGRGGTSPSPKRDPVREGAGRATTDDSKSTASSTSSGPTPSPTLSARDLFEKASQRRRAGDASGAAHAYEELLRAYPGDRRAGLSAFELGRLRMDRLRDGPGAVAALERALSLEIGPGLREDALARLASVFASQGNFSACASTRDRYLKSYPSGVHALTVASRCAAR